MSASTVSIEPLDILSWHKQLYMQLPTLNTFSAHHKPANSPSNISSLASCLDSLSLLRSQSVSASDVSCLLVHTPQEVQARLLTEPAFRCKLRVVLHPSCVLLHHHRRHICSTPTLPQYVSSYRHCYCRLMVLRSPHTYL